MFTKTQLFTAAVAAASASTVLAAPMYGDATELEVRGPGASKEIKDNIAKVAGSKAGRKAAVELGKNVYTKVAGNALDEQKKKDAAKQNQHHGSSKKRDLEEVLEELFARGPGASKEIKDNIAKVAGSKAGRKAAVELGKNVYTKVAGNALDDQKKKDAAKQNQHHGSSKRDLEDALEELFAREFDDLEELYGRGPGASKEIKDNIAKVAGSKAGRKAAVELGKNVYTKVAGNALDEQKKKDAAKQNQHHGSSKRDLEDMLEDLFAREIDDLEELYARGPGASKEIKDNIAKVAGSKAGRKAAVELGKNVYTKVAGNALDEQKKKDAAKQNQHHGSSKRDLEDVLEDLFARGPGASKEIKDNIAKVAGSKAGRKAAVELGKNVYTKVAGNALDEQKKKDAAKQNQHHGSSKRDLEDMLEDLFAREFDDLEELYARGPGASKEIKDNIAKVAGSKAGRKAAVELGKNVYTKVAGNALDEQKKKDAAKQNQHQGGSKKRDLLELFERELEFYDELD